MASLLGDRPAAIYAYEQALIHARAAGYAAGEAFALYYLGFQGTAQGDRARARALYEESLALYRTLNDRGGIGIVLRGLGETFVPDNLVQAEVYYQDSLAIFREINHQQLTTITLCDLAELALAQGNDALGYAEEGLVRARELGSPDCMVRSLLVLGKVAQREGALVLAHGYVEEALERARAWGEQEYIARCRDELTTLVPEADGHGAATASASDRVGQAM